MRRLATLHCSPWLVPAVFLPLLVLSGCESKSSSAPSSSKASEQGKSGKGGPGAGKSRQFTVRTTPVNTQPVSYEIEAVGALVEENLYNIPAQVAGAIEQLSFAEGDAVTTGQELCRIDYQRYLLLAERAKRTMLQQEATVKKVEAQYLDTERKTSTAIETARVDLEQAESEWRRRTEMATGNVISAEERTKYQAAYRRALSASNDALSGARTQMALALATLEEERTALDASRVSLALAEQDLKNSIVRAPVAGVIQLRSITQSQYVLAGNKIAVMVQNDPLRLRFTVPESKSAALRKDMKLTFSVPAYPDRSFEAKLYSVGSMLDTDTREVPCWARVDNAHRLLRPGYFTKVKVQVASRKDAVVIPLASVLPTERGMICYTVEEGKAVRRSVETGIQVSGDRIEILSGLKAGQQIIVEGVASVQDKVPVKIVNEMQGDSPAPKDGAADKSGSTGKSQASTSRSSSEGRAHK